MTRLEHVRRAVDRNEVGMVDEAPSPQQVLVVTGMSGAGRSTAANVLEDLDWYVVDNLPPQMLRPLTDLASRAEGAIPKIAAVVDVRGRDFFAALQDIVQSMRDGSHVRILFLDASDAALVRRFEAVRRPHPLQGSGTIIDGIRIERGRLSAIRESSDIVIDTSDFNIHQLATKIRALFSDDSAPSLHLTVMSFGFKYGLPPDADLVADARFLPNPFWVPELKPLTGLDEPVSEYVMSREGATEFLDHYLEALVPVLDGYQRENKRHAVVAVGCTGGKHRSVAMTEYLASRLGDLDGVAVTLNHRDLGRE